jgi:protein arginine kinase
VLIHLPGLVLTAEIDKVHRAVAEMGMAVRGWFGEGSGALGDFFQLSHQRTLGVDEAHCLDGLGRIAGRVLQLERDARERISAEKGHRRKIEDRVHRAYGVLRTARLLSAEQVMACASDVRLARSLGVLEEVSHAFLNRLLLFTQSAHLRAGVGDSFRAEDENWERARWVREEFDEFL